jgi:hypothetical protein
MTLSLMAILSASLDEDICICNRGGFFLVCISASWFIEMKKILIKYDLPDIIQLLENPPKKEKWKTLVYMHVYRYWQDEIIITLKWLLDGNKISRLYIVMLVLRMFLLDVMRLLDQVHYFHEVLQTVDYNKSFWLWLLSCL